MGCGITYRRVYVLMVVHHLAEDSLATSAMKTSNEQVG